MLFRSAVELLLACFDRLAPLGQGPSAELPERLALRQQDLEQLGGQLTALAGELTARGSGPDAASAASPSVSAASPTTGAALSASSSGLAAERVVKVDALQLNRIAALAGESMVAARWLQPYADSLQQLRARQRELAELIGRWPAAEGDPQALAIRDKERQCEELLQQQLEELEAFARRTNTIAHRLYEIGRAHV